MCNLKYLLLLPWQCFSCGENNYTRNKAIDCSSFVFNVKGFQFNWARVNVSTDTTMQCYAASVASYSKVVVFCAADLGEFISKMLRNVEPLKTL